MTCDRPKHPPLVHRGCLGKVGGVTMAEGCWLELQSALGRVAGESVGMVEGSGLGRPVGVGESLEGGMGSPGRGSTFRLKSAAALSVRRTFGTSTNH